MYYCPVIILQIKALLQYLSNFMYVVPSLRSTLHQREGTMLRSQDEPRILSCHFNFQMWNCISCISWFRLHAIVSHIAIPACSVGDWCVCSLKPVQLWLPWQEGKTAFCVKFWIFFHRAFIQYFLDMTTLTWYTRYTYLFEIPKPGEGSLKLLFSFLPVLSIRDFMVKHILVTEAFHF